MPANRLAAVNFRITAHSGSGAPSDALELLLERLGPRREEARFARGTGEIRVSWGEDEPVSMESDEREEIGRLAVLGVLEEVCDRSPELRLDWFAVSARRY